MQTHVHVVWILLPQATKQQSELRKPHPVSEQRQGRRWTLTQNQQPPDKGGCSPPPPTPTPAVPAPKDPPLQTPGDWRRGVTFFYEDRGLGQLCHSSDIWDPRKVLTGTFPLKENWGAPLHNWVRKEKQSPDETRSISLNYTLRT